MSSMTSVIRARANSRPGQFLSADLGVQVDCQDRGRPGVAQKGCLYVLLDDVPPDHPDRRHERRFLEGVRGAHRPAPGRRAAHVELVEDDAGPGHELVAVEHRCHHSHVHGVECAGERVVRQEDVAGPDVLAEHPPDALHDQVQSGRHPDDPDSGEQPSALAVEDAGVVVAGLVHGGRCRHARGENADLVVDLPEPVPHDLESDVVHLLPPGVQ
jgi:hypothetical protein